MGITTVDYLVILAMMAISFIGANRRKVARVLASKKGQ